MSTGWRFSERGDGVDHWIADLHDMERGDRIKHRMDAVTAEFCEALRATMPVRSGALKFSGTWASRMTGDAYGETYEADVTFGGPLAPYAPFVVGEHRDGEHAWDRVLPEFIWQFQEVIDAEFRA